MQGYSPVMLTGEIFDWLVRHSKKFFKPCTWKKNLFSILDRWCWTWKANNFLKGEVLFSRTLIVLMGNALSISHTAAGHSVHSRTTKQQVEANTWSAERKGKKNLWTTHGGSDHSGGKGGYHCSRLKPQQKASAGRMRAANPLSLVHCKWMTH